MTTLDLLNRYLNAFFVDHAPESILDLITDDIHCYGFAGDKVVESRRDAKAMLADPDYRRYMKYELTILEQQTLADDTALLCYSLAYGGVSVRYRVIGTARRPPEGLRLRLLHFSMADPKHTLNLFAEQQRLQKEADENNRMLEAACDFAHVWFWVYDPAREQAHCYSLLQRDFGLPEYLNNYPEVLLSGDYVEPAYKALYRQKLLAMKNGSPSEEFELRQRYRDGSLHWVRIRCNRPACGPDLILCTAQPIDDEKYLEARIEVEEKQQAEGGSSLLAHFVTNLTRNKPLAHSYHFIERDELLHWASPEEQLQLTLPYIAYPEKREAFVAMHNNAHLLAQFAAGHTHESLSYRRRMPNGQIRWVRSIIHMVQEPRTGDILNYEYLYDIHHQKVSEELISAVVSFGYELCASLMLDCDQVTILRSQRQHGETGLEVVPYLVANTAYAQTILPEDRQMYLDACAPESIVERLKTEDHFEIMHRTLENGEIHYKKDQCYGYNPDRTVCLLVRSDVTDVVMAERRGQDDLKKALEAAEAATQAKTEFLSRMSHEIRTPMNAIMGMTAIAKESRADYDQVGECLDKIDMSSRFLLTLINDILEMSRIESGRTEIKHTEFSFTFLAESIRTVVEPLAVKSGVRYEFINRADTEPYYLGDAMRIQQVLVNIITNAIKFTKNGGRVRFSINLQSQTPTQALFHFVVADTGIGMSREFMNRMFQPFTQEDGSNTSQFGGSGLGLAISRSLTEAMGGSISAESFQGVGSTFTIALPLDRVDYSIQPEPERPEPAQPARHAALQGCRVLMAEDHPLNVMVARKLLERQGVTVTVAENGRKALDTFRGEAPGSFDAILMDIRMPVMDGLDAARAIRALERPDAKNIPIIAMTANALDEDRQRSRAAGMNAHLAKPFEPAQLYAVLAEQIENARVNGGIVK